MNGKLRKLADFVHGKAPLYASRSSQWPAKKREFLLKHPFCKACGGTKSLEVHHIIPFHIDPSLELEDSNLVTLCESGKYGINCHLYVGHKGNYRDHNPSVLSFSAFLLAYIQRRTQL